MKLGLFVVVSDLETSKAFYEKLFRSEPYFKTDTFVAFDVSGGLYGLFLQRAYDHPLIKGSNTVPYLRVDDIEAEFARVSPIATTMIHQQIVQEGPIRLFRFADPDGNLIEFFSVGR